MKTKISVSIEQETLAQLEQLITRAPEYRSKSHLIELAIRKQLAEKQELQEKRVNLRKKVRVRLLK